MRPIGTVSYLAPSEPLCSTHARPCDYTVLLELPMTQFTSEDDPFFAEDLLQMEKAVNYRRWQFSIIAPHVKGTVVEVGGGVGNFTADLAATAQSVISLEPNHFCYEQLAQKTRHLKNVTTLNIASESLQEHMPAGYQADTLVCLNV